MYLSETEGRLLSINESGKSYPTLKQDERDALHSVISDDKLIIKPADKGSTEVVWSNHDYVLEQRSQLNDTKIYKKWSSNPMRKVNTEIKSVSKDMLNRKEIDKKHNGLPFDKTTSIRQIDLQPKIHKRTSNVPGQTVVSNDGTATKNVSAFLDFHLKTIVPTVPHNLEDTRDFLSRLNELCEIS